MNGKLFYFIQSHIRVFLYSFARLLKVPGQSLMTILLIGIAFTLPLVFTVFLNNAESLVSGLKRTGSISIYLEPAISEVDRNNLEKELLLNSEVSSVNYVSPEQGLLLLKEHSGIEGIEIDFSGNPLPPVFLVELHSNSVSQELIDNFKTLSGVEFVQADLAWLDQLLRIFTFAEKINGIFAIFLSITVFLIVNYAIYFMVHRYRQEIKIIQLVGGTGAFIRRPFLYQGIWLGFLGALLAGLLVTCFLMVLQSEFISITAYYGQDVGLQAILPIQWFYLLMSGGLLGYLGGWLATYRYIRLLA